MCVSKLLFSPWLFLPLQKQKTVLLSGHVIVKIDKTIFGLLLNQEIQLHLYGAEMQYMPVRELKRKINKKWNTTLYPKTISVILTHFFSSFSFIQQDYKKPTDWTSFPPTKEHVCATPARLEELYQKQLSNPSYQQLLNHNITIFGALDGKFHKWYKWFFFRLSSPKRDKTCHSLRKLSQIMTMDVTMVMAPTCTVVKVL